MCRLSLAWLVPVIYGMSTQKPLLPVVSVWVDDTSYGSYHFLSFKFFGPQLRGKQKFPFHYSSSPFHCLRTPIVSHLARQWHAENALIFAKYAGFLGKVQTLDWATGMDYWTIGLAYLGFKFRCMFFGTMYYFTESQCFTWHFPTKEVFCFKLECKCWLMPDVSSIEQW